MSDFYQKKLVGNSGVTFGFSSKKNIDKQKIRRILLGTIGVFVLVVAFWFTKNVLQDLPDISQVKDMVFSEATEIQDRNGKTLYRLYEENRQYVDFSGINQHMINAIVAVEDQRYREHNGLDPMGIARAALNNVFHPGRGLQGASTIPQQLVRNLLLFKGKTFSEKVARKFKEIILTSRLDSVLEKQIRQEKGKLGRNELREEMKNKVLELYLNYIFLGNNAYGVEAASKTYFSKSAKDIDILESSILASIPKGPSLYDPYKKRALVMGEIIIKDNDGNKQQFTGDLKRIAIDLITSKINSLDIESKNKDKTFSSLLDSLGEMSFSASSGGMYTMIYKSGRKDFALTRMLEDGYITANEAKLAFLESLDYTFRKNTIEMIAPHFVQWIIEELEKEYDKETLFKGGIVVKTSLDLDIQKKAEEALNANLAVLQDNGANNSSMIYLDSKNGDVLAYVGSINYFDEKIQGQNDMIRSPRQSGSSIKPFIYALGFEKLPLTLDTPMFDIPFQIGKDKPNNADDKFSGILPLKHALAQSRNIPATKMILGLGGEEVAKPFLQKLGLKGVKSDVEYGYTLALGAAEVTMLELATAYSHLSTSKPATINPILEIRARDGSLIYEKKVEQTEEEIIKPGVGYLLWKILSEPANRLAGWVSKFNVSGLTMALKTGTSNVKTDKGNRPRDGWLATYTPSKVAVFWAGNADGAAMNRNAFGGTIHANPMKSFFTALIKNNLITNETIKPIDTSNVQISKISGKIATDKTPSEFVVDTTYYIRGIALGEDNGAEVFDYDSFCNGALSQSTPAEDIRKGYFLSPSTFMTNNMDLKEITDWFKQGSSFTGKSLSGYYSSGHTTYNFNNIFVSKPTTPCESRIVKNDPTIQVNISQPNTETSAKFSLRFGVNASKSIKNVFVTLDDKQIAQYTYKGNQTSLNEIKTIILPADFKDGKHILKVAAVDSEGFSNETTKEINITTSDTEAPRLLEEKIKIQSMGSGVSQVTLIFEDTKSFVEKGSINSSGTVLKNFEGNLAIFEISSLGSITIKVKDAYGNELSKEINLANYPAQ